MERKKNTSECKFVGIEGNKLSYNCKKYNNKSDKPINGLIKKFPNIYKFCNKDVHKFGLLLRKGVYPYKYMDGWEKFNETSLPDQEAFYSELNKEGITDKDYTHAQNVWEVFEIKNLR